MSHMQRRHNDLATAATTAGEKALHLHAARLHGEAHLSELHRRAALAATSMAFDSRCGGTELAGDAGSFEEGKHPRADNGKFGSGSGASQKNAGLGKPLHSSREISDRIEARKTNKALPKSAKDYAHAYQGFNSEHGENGAHEFEFKNSAEQEKFLHEVGGAPHPHGGHRAILED